MHLLKVVVEARGGDWVRDLELDGDFATYEPSCDQGQDPWGCAMLGRALVQGDPAIAICSGRAPSCQRPVGSDRTTRMPGASQLRESLNDMPPAGPGEAPRTGW